MKKLFTLLFAIVASVATMFADIINYVQIDDFFYNLDTSAKTAEVNTWYTTSLNIVIPSSVSYNGGTYSVISIGEDAFRDCEMTNVTIPTSITHIGYRAFYYCKSLTSVTVPASLTSIESWAFNGCTNLTSVVWNATNIEEAPVFGGCNNLTSFIFGSGVETIPEDICNGLTKLNTVTIPSSVKVIGSSAFESCKGLTSITLTDGITSIGNQAFENCTSLVSINIPSSVTYIGTYAFEGCKNLTSPIVIPEGVTKLDDGVFINCSSLTSISLPQSLSRLEGTYFGTFAGCEGLEGIYVHRDTPANADSNTFNGVDKYSCTLYVPRNSISLYKNAPVWRDFYNVEAIEDVMAIDDIEIGGASGHKVIRDGQVLIERNDKTYMVNGQEL